MSAAAIEELERLLGAKVVTDPDKTSPWSRDQSPVAEVGTPLAVVRASSTDDVVATLRTATRYGVPVVTRGGGLRAGRRGERRRRLPRAQRRGDGPDPRDRPGPAHRHRAGRAC